MFIISHKIFVISIKFYEELNFVSLKLIFQNSR